MTTARRISRTVLATLLLLAPMHLLAQAKPTVAQFVSPPFPLQLVAAKNVDRVAWTQYDHGMRNAYTAVAPDFRPVRVSRFLTDDGIEIGQLSISDDGSVVVFVRGGAPNGEGWVINPTHDPDGGDRAIWAARTTAPGDAWRVAEGTSPVLSPDGRWVLFVKAGQIHRARVTQTATSSAMDKGVEPFIQAWGTQSNPRWSPDGSKIAFVSDRDDHAFIALYDVRTRAVSYVAPSVDRDGSPVWSPDGKRIAFIRRPGTPFGVQVQNAAGGNNGGAGGDGRAAAAGGRGGGGGGRGGTDVTGTRAIPGLYTATLQGGYTASFMIADVATGEAREFWHSKPSDPVFGNVGTIRWAGDHVVFSASVPDDDWDRYYSVALDGSTADPVLLTTTNGMIEGVGETALSPDGKTFYYCTNAQDIERRHIWAVPTSGGTPRQITTGEGVETAPAPLASGARLGVLYADARMPRSPAIAPTQGGAAKVITTLPKDFPYTEQVIPEVVRLASPDGLEVSSQLFLPKDLRPGERRPALIFVHGGPARQMLPAYHYMEVYHMFYGINQWLANQGYVVMSVNYRSGIGYGRSFQRAPNTGQRGNAEYQDVLAAGKYLQSRADVDPTRVGIWGLSYGGILTSQALARNSDVFVAGVDLAGVHLWGSQLDTAAVSYRASAISEIANWKSPVLLIHGDDDRNVSFSQTVGLVSLLRAHDVYHELIVLPDDPHETQLHSRWLYLFGRMDTFLDRFVRNRATATTNGRPPL